MIKVLDLSEVPPQTRVWKVAKVFKEEGTGVAITTDETYVRVYAGVGIARKLAQALNWSIILLEDGYMLIHVERHVEDILKVLDRAKELRKLVVETLRRISSEV